MTTYQAIGLATAIACISSCAPMDAPYGKATSDPHIAIAPAGNPVWVEKPKPGTAIQSNRTGEWFRWPEATEGAPDPEIPYLKPTKEQRFAIDPSGKLVQTDDAVPGQVVSIRGYEGKYFRIPQADPNAPSPSSVPGYIHPAPGRRGYTPGNPLTDPVLNMQINLMNQQLQNNFNSWRAAGLRF